MSSGAVFILLSSEGKCDKMLLATDLLEQRMNAIRQRNRQQVIAQGKNPDSEDIDPQLSQIQETHIIHFQSRFKPYCPIAMEYQKVTPQSGSASFGN
jgi:hypothetical protein